MNNKEQFDKKIESLRELRDDLKKLKLEKLKEKIKEETTDSNSNDEERTL